MCAPIVRANYLERVVCELFSFKYVNGICDAVGQEDGRLFPVEIKSCLRFTHDWKRGDGKRRGTFKIEREQYDQILADNGVFIFVICDDSRAIGSIYWARASEFEYRWRLSSKLVETKFVVERTILTIN